MKISTLFVIFLCLFIFTYCGENQPEAANKPEADQKEQTSLASSSLPEFSNEYLVSIYEKQELIKISEDNLELRKTFCQYAYHPESKLFVTMGIGSLKHPESGRPIPRQNAERAATLDAYRWASYGETWLNNQYQPAFGKLDTYFRRPGTVIERSVVGDSLFVFIAIEIVGK